MGEEAKQQLHAFFFPFMAQGHMLPMVDMAKLFAAHGVRATLVFTPFYASLFEKTVNRAQAAGSPIDFSVIAFPPEADLGEGDEDLDRVTTPEARTRFFRAVRTLEKPFRCLVDEQRPHCLFSDIFLPWTATVAVEAGIPRLVFHGSSFFSFCAMDSLRRHLREKKVASDEEVFVLPGLPGEIPFTGAQMPLHMRSGADAAASQLWADVHMAEEKEYGQVGNSFYELEPEYIGHFKGALGKRAWHVGPVSLCNRQNEEMAERGKQAAIDRYECLSWLDSQKPGSVLYLCFGSFCKFPPPQLLEMAAALESGASPFIWVVKNGESLPEGFEDRTRGKGLVIRGWAPQILILNHPAVGGFVTHCGWNSVLEGVAAGVPLVAWPVSAEQFINEKLITRVLKNGVGVGAWRCTSPMETDRPVIGRAAIEEAVRRVMGDAEEARRTKEAARELGEMAKKALDKGGSSDADLNRLIQELGVVCSGVISN